MGAKAAATCPRKSAIFPEMPPSAARGTRAPPETRTITDRRRAQEAGRKGGLGKHGRAT